MGTVFFCCLESLSFAYADDMIKKQKIKPLIRENRGGGNTVAVKRKEVKMRELYEAIEAKIKESGYPRSISGEDVYDDICNQIEDKENGTYMLLSKFEDDVIVEYNITIMDDDFNLGVMTIRTPEGVYEVDFDK